MDPKDFTPEGRPNHYLHPTLGVCVLREDMSLKEFIASLGALDSPPPPPLPEPDPRDVKIAALEARLAQIESRTEKIEADVTAKLAVKA